MKKFALFVFVFTAFLLASLANANAQKGTYYTHSTTWNGIARTYLVYIPPVLPPNPVMVMALHGTFTAPQSTTPPNICHTGGLDVMADPLELVLVCPIASWKAKGTSGVRFWNSYETDADFPVVPDDSGFLRSLILQLEQPVASGGLGVSRVYGVVGMSSGGMMAHRLCIENSDLVPACAIESGNLYVGAVPPALPLPTQPVSILEVHGTADPTLFYCGGMFAGWGSQVYTPSVDVDVNYWLAADGLPPNQTPLCTSGAPTPGLLKVGARAGSVEVEFLALDGYGHQFNWWVVSAAFEFFSTHGRMQ